MKYHPFVRSRVRNPWMIGLTLLVVCLFATTSAAAEHASDGKDVKVTNDNNNVDGGTPNPSFDAQNFPSNEATLAINPANPDIVAARRNDYRMISVTGDVWLGVYLSRRQRT